MGTFNESYAMKFSQGVGAALGTTMVLVNCSIFFSSRRGHTSLVSDWSSDVCSSDLAAPHPAGEVEIEAVADRAGEEEVDEPGVIEDGDLALEPVKEPVRRRDADPAGDAEHQDRKSTRLNSSH